MQKWKQIAGLATLLVGLGALATWDEWKTKKEEKEKETKGLLLSIKPEMIVGLRVKSLPDDGGGDKTAEVSTDITKITDATLRLDNGKWMITSPVSTPADQQVITDLLKNVTDYKTESEVSTSKEQWAQFGLTSPRRDIEIETNDGKRINFYVGLNTPVGFSVYTATSTEPKVYTGSQYIATSTGKTLFDLREKKVLSGSASDVTAVNLTSITNKKSETISIVQADGKWSIQKPVTASGDTVSIKNYLDDLFSIKASEFIDNPSKELMSALSEQNLFAKLELQIKDTQTKLIIAQTKDTLYGQILGLPTVYKLSDEVRGKIVKTVKDLRDKKIFGFGSTDVSKVTIDGEIFTKVSTDWYRAEDAGKFNADGKFSGKSEDKPAATNHVRGLVVDLEYARAEDIFDPKSDVARNLPKAPKHRVILGLAPKESDITVDVWTAQDNPEMIYIRRSGNDQIFKAKRSTIASITPAKTAPVGEEATGLAPLPEGAQDSAQ